MNIFFRKLNETNGKCSFDSSYTILWIYYSIPIEGLKSLNFKQERQIISPQHLAETLTLNQLSRTIFKNDRNKLVPGFEPDHLLTP